MNKSVVSAAIAALTLLITPASQSAENLENLFTPVARGDHSTESVYFVMTDRFADGDTSNNLDGYNPSGIGYWHGGDFKGLTSKLDYIQSMGFTAIWVTPPFVQQSIQGDSAAYHGYWALDFMHVDPHLGSDQDFKEFIAKAHALGLKVIMDVIANHTADVIQYTNGKPYIPAGKENIKNPAFLNDLSNYHNQGPSTFEGDSLLLGDFYGLDDIATEKPVVVQGFIDIWSYWIKNYSIDGLRIDTFRHVNPEFWKTVIPAIQKIAKASGKKTFPIFGEVAEGNPDTLANYVVTGQTPSVLDFGFNQEITRYVANFGQADRLAQLFNLDDLYTTASTSAYGLATFTGNHDMGRIGQAILSNAASADDALKQVLITQAALFFLRGGPILYYGDEHGMTGAGGDKLARQDMFPTQVSRWSFEQRIGEGPIGSASSFDISNPIKTSITSMQALVKANPALRNGTQQTLYASGQLFAVSRYSQKQEYIVAFNAGDNDGKMSLSVINKKSAWNQIAGTCSASPGASISIPAHSFCVLKSALPIVKSATSKLSAPKLSDSNDSALWKEVSVTVNAPGYNQVTFLVREKGGSWKNLGTSDHTTFDSSAPRYRTFLHPSDFKPKTKLELIAVMQNSDGRRFVSQVSKAVND